MYLCFLLFASRFFYIYIYLKLIFTLFDLFPLQGIVERMCSLPPNTIDEVVALAIQLLECKDASARKDACSFLGHVFVSSAFINSFDSHDGLRRLLSHLHNAVQPSPANDSGSSFLFSPKASTIAKAYDACFALRRYMRAHLLLLVDSIRPSKRFFHAPMNISNAREAYKPLDLSDEALAAVSYQIHKDWELGSAFIRARWPVVDEFLNSNGHVTMFELCRQVRISQHLRKLLRMHISTSSDIFVSFRRTTKNQRNIHCHMICFHISSMYCI